MRSATYTGWWMSIGVIAVLAGCEPVPTTQSQPGGCSNPQACQAAAYIASGAQSVVGQDAGNGMKFEAVRAIGSTVVMDMRAPDKAATLGVGVDPRLDALLNKFIKDTAAVAVCTPDPAGMTAKPFFDMGGRLRVRVISSDGVVASDSTVTSCSGIS